MSGEETTTALADNTRYSRLKRKWGIVFKAAAITAVLMGIKWYIDINGWAVIPINALVTALLSGVFFTIGILFAGAVSDYKESEKIPGELAVSIKTLYKDTTVINLPAKDRKIVQTMQSHVVELLSTLNSNFRRNVWKLREIDAAIDKITDDIRILSEKGVAPGYITKFRSELSTIDRFAHRIDVISETSFIPAAYAIAEIAIISILSILMFVDVGIPFGALIILAATSAILISLVFLIKDMDSPFEVGQNTYADVDLSMLFKLEDYMKSLKKKNS